MAANGRRPRRRYNTPGVVNDNLARKLDSKELERRLERSGQLDFDQQYRKRKETEAEQLARRRARAKAAVRPAQKVSIKALLGFAAVASLMVALLLCYIKINAISRNIVQMKNQISMTQPSDSQVYYIDLPGEDQAVSYGNEGASVLSRIFTSLGRGVYAVVEYFR